jgi:hypothetical protein
MLKTGNVMSRAQRFPNKIEFWTNDQQLRGLELLASDGLTDKATHMRQALKFYLRQFGVAPAAGAPNGQHHQPAE